MCAQAFLNEYIKKKLNFKNYNNQEADFWHKEWSTWRHQVLPPTYNELQSTIAF